MRADRLGKPSSNLLPRLTALAKASKGILYRDLVISPYKSALYETRLK
jgi:hypothetical protein